MELIQKISDLTTVPINTYEHLINVLNMIHSQDIITQKISNNESFAIDTFEGTIYLNVIDDNIHYKFVPNDEFKKIITSTIINNKSVLVRVATDKLKRTLTDTYKDII